MSNVVNFNNSNNVKLDLNNRLGVFQLTLALVGVEMSKIGYTTEEINLIIENVSDKVIPVLASANTVEILPDSSKLH